MQALAAHGRVRAGEEKINLARGGGWGAGRSLTSTICRQEERVGAPLKVVGGEGRGGVGAGTDRAES